MPRLATEPGRSIVAPAGVTLYRVGTIKQLPAGTGRRSARVYVSVDGGMSDNPRPALYGAEYEAFLPARPRPTATRWSHDRREALRAGRCARA